MDQSELIFLKSYCLLQANEANNSKGQISDQIPEVGDAENGPLVEKIMIGFLLLHRAVKEQR